MLDGECIKQVFYLISKPVGGNPAPTLELPSLRSFDCCSTKSFNCFGDINTADQFNNDVTGFLWYYEDVVTSASITLSKYNDGVYEDILLLNNDDLGTFYEYGFYVNSFSEKFIGYKLEWRKVLIAHGAGSYKVRVDFVSALGNTGSEYSFEYCLKQYTKHRAEGTVRVEYYLNGVFGNNTDDTVRRDYGVLNWYNSLRLDGIFSYIKSPYQEDHTEYNNGLKVWVKNEQEPEYQLVLKPANWDVHNLMRTDVLMSDSILITDYNSKNFGKWIQKAVQKTSEYAPNFFLTRSQNASVKLTFRQSQNNYRRSRC